MKYMHDLYADLLEIAKRRHIHGDRSYQETRQLIGAHIALTAVPLLDALSRYAAYRSLASPSATKSFLLGEIVDVQSKMERTGRWR